MLGGAVFVVGADVDAISALCSCNISDATTIGGTIRGVSLVKGVEHGVGTDDGGTFGETETLVTGGHQEEKAGLILAGG